MTDGPKSDIPVGTPEGYTKEEPAVEELGEPGTPGAGMSVAAPHAADAEDAHDAAADDDHGHAEAALGPIDWGAWAWAVVGATLGLVVLAFFYLAIV
jgi:hypothetical protein